MQVELSKGTVLSGRFQIDDVLGVGGFGITYLGHHMDLGYKCAIKEYFISGKFVRQNDGLTVGYQGISEEQFVKYKSRFLDEARTLVKVKNRHVVSVLDVFEAHNTAYIIMEFIEGTNLQEKVRREGPLDYPLAVNYIAQLSEAVECCHQRHILHRDIKPDNVMITPDNRVVLIDFGSARGFVNDEVQRHTAILTQGYAPIEQYTSTSKKGNYTDIYSLGGVFYYAVTGHKPMDATDRMLSEMPSPKTYTPDLPDEAEKTIMKAMQMKPEDRYQNIGEFMDDLVGKQITSEVPQKINIVSTKVTEEPKNFQTVQSPKTPQVPQTTPAPKSNKALYASLIVIGILLIIIGGALYNHFGIQEPKRVEKLRAIYNEETPKCAKFIASLNFLDNPMKLQAPVDAIAKIQDFESARLFPKTKCKAQSKTLQSAYLDSLKSIRFTLEQEIKIEKSFSKGKETDWLIELQDKQQKIDNTLSLFNEESDIQVIKNKLKPSTK